VAGYSHIAELNEEASTATLRMYGAVVEESIIAHRGHVFSSAGDGVVAEFPSVVEAIRCAVEIQNEIAERNAAVPEDGRMQFRIGVNLGDVIAEENNLYGTGVNVAVRLEQLAEAGGICISQTVYDQVRKIVEIPFEDIGERRLKNVRYLGWAYEEASMPKEAIAILKPEIDVKNPDDDQLWFFPTLAASYANPIVGRMDDAHRIVRTLLSHKPAFSISKNVSELPYKTDEQRDRYVNALRRAGLPE
jgi:adenylate/guanylate cyclase family protein